MDSREQQRDRHRTPLLDKDDPVAGVWERTIIIGTSTIMIWAPIVWLAVTKCGEGL